MKYYHGYTHFVHPALLPLWKLICCRLGWHAWDEVFGGDLTGFKSYLVCDACEEVIGIFDEKEAEQIELDPRTWDNIDDLIEDIEAESEEYEKWLEKQAGAESNG